MAIDKKLLTEDLIDLVGEENVISSDERLKEYSSNPFDYTKIPLLVVKPSNIKQFKRLNFILRRHKIDSITPRGFGLDINLGSYSDDLVVDLTLLNEKVEIDTQNLIVTAQAGVSYKELQEKLVSKGYRIPIEPILNGTVGGFISTGGYGYGSYRYGSVMNFLRNTSIILSSGQVIQSGTEKFPPYACGYNLNSLVCGSEGYFGIITEAIFEIIPASKDSLPILISIENETDLLLILKQLVKFSTLNNVAVYHGLLNTNTGSTDILITLEGSRKAIEQDQEDLDRIQGINRSSSELSNNLWDNRIIEPSQIPPSSAIIETIIPLKNISSFQTFWQVESSAYLGIPLNPSTILMYVFLPKDLNETQISEINAKFTRNAGDLQAYPPTIGHFNKSFVKKHYPNLEILMELKSVFDKLNRLKSRMLTF